MVTANTIEDCTTTLTTISASSRRIKAPNTVRVNAAAAVESLTGINQAMRRATPRSTSVSTVSTASSTSISLRYPGVGAT